MDSTARENVSHEAPRLRLLRTSRRRVTEMKSPSPQPSPGNSGRPEAHQKMCASGLVISCSCTILIWHLCMVPAQSRSPDRQGSTASQGAAAITTTSRWRMETLQSSTAYPRPQRSQQAQLLSGWNRRLLPQFQPREQDQQTAQGLECLPPAPRNPLQQPVSVTDRQQDLQHHPARPARRRPPSRAQVQLRSSKPILGHPCPGAEKQERSAP